MRSILALGVAGLLAAPAVAADMPTLTQDSGAPVGDNQHSKAAGPEPPLSGIKSGRLASRAISAIGRGRGHISPQARGDTLRELLGPRSHEQLASANPFSALAWEATE
jgi:hypothetical protein